MRSVIKVFTVILMVCLSLINHRAYAEDGYDLWLRYKKIEDIKILEQYRKQLISWHVTFATPTGAAIRRELASALPMMFDQKVSETAQESSASLVVTVRSRTGKETESVNPDAYWITSIKKGDKSVIVIRGETEVAALYGAFHFLKLLQTNQGIAGLNINEAPKINIRILNHWDNLDRTVERGYAGFSLWDWHKLPDYIDPRYIDYARANASIGINATVLTNVNANALVLSPAYLEKVKAIADVFRPYGIKVYLTARFNAPMELGGMATADPADPSVQQWWNDKAKEIYTMIPDFGGFLVKANSEGQPGPQTYKRTHAEGANMLARAVKSFGGVVMWRAFVYAAENKTDRARQAYQEFKPLDGKFDDNVILQVKNGPLDFQPREPFHPLFGAMPNTTLMPEFQITQEYLGFATHLVYLAPLFKECFDADTYAFGKGSTVASIVDGSRSKSARTAIAGVANNGNERNWCGHPFAQANWYAFGRLAWNHTLTAEQISEEWTRMTFGNDDQVIKTCKEIMSASREAVVNYMTPLGLHHIMGWDHHYGPGPWVANKPRPDWTAVYYHKADAQGIGFDRTTTGSGALDDYSPTVQKLYSDPSKCPDKFLLWFHHLPWDYKLSTGNTLWDELCNHYQSGTESVAAFQKGWNSLKSNIDNERFDHVSTLLTIQYKEAKWWHDACLLYFQQFSRMPFPSGVTKPEHTLKFYEGLEFPYAPGIKPKW